MSKDYERAARLCQDTFAHCENDDEQYAADEIVTAFVSFFASDNPRFDEARFRRACIPGANVRARGKTERHPDEACGKRNARTGRACIRRHDHEGKCIQPRIIPC